MLGDLEHPPSLELDSKKGIRGDEEDLLRRARIGEVDGEDVGEGTRWQRMEGGNEWVEGGKRKVERGKGRMEGVNGKMEAGNGNLEGGNGASSDLDFVIDVTQTEPKSMSLQVTFSSHAFSASSSLFIGPRLPWVRSLGTP